MSDDVSTARRRNKAAADAPPMDGQTAWTNSGQPPNGIAEPPSAEEIAENERKLDLLLRNEQSNASGKRKGPRSPRSPARAAVYVERIIMGYTLAQRRAIYGMLSAVCEMTPNENKLAGGLVDAMRDA